MSSCRASFVSPLLLVWLLIDLVVDGDDFNEPRGTKQYRDEFTDNDSDVFGDGDGDDSDAYGLHSHVRE